jgi:hypothetical protein
MADTTEQTTKAEGAARGPRSPNFPAISLQDALAKARILYDRDKRNPVRVTTILQHLGFGEKLSGSSARVMSALRQFGLLDEADEHYRITDAAFRIFTLSEGAPERIKALQDCAKRPAIYRELLTKYEDGLPSDAALRDALILRKFNPASVDTFIRVFKTSIDFAKLTPGGYSSSSKDGDVNPSKLGLGDYVQWESQGALQFEAPRKITGLSEDENFAFVEGTATGIPMEQLTKAEPPSPPPIHGAHIQSQAQMFPPKVESMAGVNLKPTDGFLALSVPFGAGSINVQVRTVGAAITSAHLARVRKYLELAEEDLRSDPLSEPRGET